MADTLEKSRSVLVVDDDVNGNQVLCDHLRFRGYRSASARSGREALDLILKAPDDQLPDVIFLDVLMPGMNGCEVLHELRSAERTRHIPVILLSVLSCEEIREQVQCDRTDFNAYVSKPFEMDAVLHKLEDVLHG